MNPIYSVMIPVCALSLITTAMLAGCNVTLSLRKKIWFIVTFVGISFGATAEFVRTLLEIHPMSSGLYKVVTLLEFSITPIMPVPLSLACGIKKQAHYVGALMMLHAVVEIALMNTGAVFSINENGKYSRGDYYAIYIMAYILSLLYLIFVFYYISKRFRNRNLFILISAVMIIFAGIIPSLINRETKTAFLGMTFMAIVLYSYFDDLTQQELADNLAAQNERIKSMQSSVIIGVANLIESRDSSTGTHIKNTSKYVEALAYEAKEAGLYPETITDDFVQMIISAAPLHDIGKIAVPDYILQKPGQFTAEEFEIMKIHAEEGKKLIEENLTGVESEEYLNCAKIMALYHHEKWDGSGYPNKVAGKDIPLCARIMAAADVLDALLSKRQYKEPMSIDEAFSIFEESRGTHFEPCIVDAVLMSREKIAEIACA